MPTFHETMYGKRFFDNQLPNLIKTLERIANALEDKNKKIEGECLWKPGDVSDEWKPGCEPNSTYNVFGVAWFKKCPYCGKDIKIKRDK